MKLRILILAAIAALALPIAPARSQHTGHSFDFSASSINGAPSGDASMTGGGEYNPSTGFIRAGGSFRCSSDIDQGPLSGCRAGEGVRWEAAQLLPSSGFKCSGAAAEPLKTAVTDDNTVVMLVRFYRQGDGNSASFTAKVFASSGDEASDLPGNQTVWIQGVGCGDALVRVR